MKQQEDLVFVQGLGFGGLIGVLIGVSITCLAFETAHPKSPPKEFEVVKSYKDCDIVRYDPKGGLTHYFLKFPNK